MFDGSIDFDSEPEKGSMFQVTFRLENMEQNQIYKKKRTSNFELNSNQLVFKWSPLDQISKEVKYVKDIQNIENMARDESSE